MNIDSFCFRGKYMKGQVWRWLQSDAMLANYFGRSQFTRPGHVEMEVAGIGYAISDSLYVGPLCSTLSVSLHSPLR